MTMTVESPTSSQLWNTMPGWGITANLLPPEIVAARRVRGIRKVVVFVIAGVFALGIAGYVYGMMQKNDADATLTASENRTVALHQQQLKYNEVVTLNGQVDQIKSQLSGLLLDDVDFNEMVGVLAARAPQGGEITQLTFTIQSASPQTTSQNTAQLNPSGHQLVGLTTISGTAKSMADVADYVVKVSTVPGVVAVYPSSQQNDGKTVKYTISLALSDVVYSHRYDLQPTTTSTTPTPGASTTTSGSATTGGK
jgi:Tfp pilus assembly protein PilO